MMRTLLWQSPGIVKVLKVSFTQWIQSNSIMLVNSGSLIGSTVVTSALGFAYWWLAARQFSLEAVGFASACVSSMLLLGSLCMLGMGTLLVTELPRQPGREVSLISSALLVVAAVGSIVGVLFALLAPYASAEFNPLRASVANTLVFAAGVSCTAVTLVFDQALIGVLRGGLQFWRNTFFAVAKLVLLFAIGIGLTQPTGITIYIAWAAGSAISLVALFAFRSVEQGFFAIVGSAAKIRASLYPASFSQLDLAGPNLSPTGTRHHSPFSQHERLVLCLLDDRQLCLCRAKCSDHRIACHEFRAAGRFTAQSPSNHRYCPCYGAAGELFPAIRHKADIRFVR